MRRVSCILICASLALLGFSFLSEAQTLPTSYTAGSYTTCLLLDTAHAKLYIGTHASLNLYVYDLVDGEPSGVPENYSAGSFTFDLDGRPAGGKDFDMECGVWVAENSAAGRAEVVSKIFTRCPVFGRAEATLGGWRFEPSEAKSSFTYSRTLALTVG